MRMDAGKVRLPRYLPLHRDRVRATRRPACSRAQFFGVEFELRDSAAESVAVHAQLARGLALVSLAVLQHGQNEFLLEFTDGFRISDAALVHLQNQSFQLVSHNASFLKSNSGKIAQGFPLLSPCSETCSGTVRNKSQPSRKRCRKSAGAAQIKARPETSRNGATRDCWSHPHCGTNAASASTMTVLITAPRTNPNSAPKSRSNQRSPTPCTAQRTIRPRTPASTTTTRNMVKNPAMSADH